MKTLILCVDRDDDLGRKTSVSTPVVGRRANAEAASALGVVDPEDSDVNAIFAAVSLYDRESKANRQVEVATIVGHRLVGLKSDRRLAKELEEVLEQVHPDEVVLVSDGAEDEQILPIISSRVRVSHVHRNVVRQAPRLEGLYYILTRMLDDEKIAKRFVLPTALVMVVWGFAFLLGIPNIAWGLTLAIFGGWLLMHAMRWEDRASHLIRDFSEGLKAGRLTLVSNLVMLLLLIFGIVQAMDRLPGPQVSSTMRAVHFIDAYLPYFVSALLVRVGGNLFDEFMRTGRASVHYWSAAFMLIAVGFIGNVALELILIIGQGGTIPDLVRFDLVVRLFVGLAVAMGGLIVTNYIRSFQPRQEQG